jgi:hypothetical protein
LFDKTGTVLLQCPGGKTGTYSIPNGVACIGDLAFYGCSGLTAVTIPNSVTNIGPGAFAACPALTQIMVDAQNSFYSSSVDGLLFDKAGTVLIQCPGGKTGTYSVPESVASIGDFAFDGSSGLTSIIIPGSVTRIGQEAFVGCSSLMGIYFQGNAPALDSSSFAGDGATTYYIAGTTGWGPNFGGLPAIPWSPLLQAAYVMTNGGITITKYSGPGGAVVIPATFDGLPITAIGDSAFSACANLTSVTLPAGLASIGDWAFSSCTSLGGVTIPDSVTNLGDWAFSACTNLAAATIGNGIVSIGDGAFDFCSGMTNAALGANVINLGAYAFDSCSNLATITLPNSLVSIGDWAFASCTKLTGVTLPTNVTRLGQEAFESCASLTRITIPNSVTNLGDEAFQFCTNLAAVTIGDGVPAIGKGAFDSCARLTNATLGKSVISVGDYAFESCTNLASVSLSQSLANVGQAAFAYCACLTNITIPGGVTNLGSRAFLGCTNLAGVYLLGSAPACDSSTFQGEQPLAYYLNGAAGWGPTFAGLSTSPWEPPDQMAYAITDGAVTVTKYLGPGGSVTVPGTIGGLPVIGIGASAFYNCAGLTSVTIPNGVTNIGFGAFIDATNLTEAFFQGNPPTIYSSIFQGDRAAAVYYLAGTTGWGASYGGAPASLWDPQAQAAYTVANGQVTITKYTGPGGSLTIPSTIAGLPVTALATEAFASATNLTDVTIPASVTSIGDWQFAWCSRLTAVTVDPLNPTYSSLDGVLLDKSQGVLIEYPPGLPGTYTLPQSVTNIWDWAFASSINLTNVTLGNSVTGIGHYAFEYCPALARLTIPQSVSVVGDGAFIDCSNLTAVFFAGDAPYAGSSLFQGDHANAYYLAGTAGWGPSFAGIPAFPWDPQTQAAYAVTNGAITLTRYTGPGGSLTIPATLAGLPLTSIGEGAFLDCAGLSSVAIPTGVTNIADYAFQNCLNLAAVTLPEGLLSIGNFAFNGCSSLAGITLPDSLASIQHDAFASCASLTNVSIPAGVTAIGAGGFAQCASLAAITVDPLNPVYSSGDGVLFNQAQTVLLQYPCGRPGAYTLPQSAVDIADSAFEYSSNLTAITIGESVTNIGIGAFAYCAALTNVTIGSGLANLSTSAFAACTALTGVYFQGNAPAVGYAVFEYDNDATLYYLPGASGWTATFGGRPALLWQNTTPAVPPALSQEPQSLTVFFGASATFTVIASGTPPLGYQWFFNGAPIPGATADSLTIDNVQAPDAGAYSVVVSNAAGWVGSSPAELTIVLARFDAPVLEPLTLVGGYPHLTWSAIPGLRYQVWFTDTLANPSWTSLGDVLVASGNTLEFTDSAAGGSSARFYRVQVLAPQ